MAEISYFLSRYKWSILLLVAIPLVIAVVYVRFTPKLYTADAYLLLDPQVLDSMQPNARSGSPFDSGYIESQIALIQSENIALAVVSKLDLMRDREFTQRFSSLLASSTSASDQFVRRRLIMSAFFEGLDIRRQGLSYAITISYTSQSPEKAAVIANAMAKAYIDDRLNHRKETLQAGGLWLEQRLDELRNQMNQASLNVQRFKARRDYRIIGEAGAPPAGESGADASEKQNSEAANFDTLDELESTLQTFRRIYESNLQAYTEALQKQSFPVVNARIITPASPPLKASSPKVPLVLAFSLLLGLMLGVGQAVLRYNLESE